MTVTRHFSPRLRPDRTARLRSDRSAPANTGKGEHGSMSVSALAGFTLFVIPSLIFVLAIPPWEADTADARDAAHNALLALSSTPNWSSAQADAEQVVSDAEAAYGVSLNATFGCDGSTTGCDLLCLPGGSTVTTTVRVAVPVGNVPGVIEHYASVGFTATYTGTIDTYAADNDCD